MLKHIIQVRLEEFVRDCRASVSLEVLLVFPALVWAYLSAFVFFDAFRAKNANQKAAYTIADMLSRQTNPINQGYLDGLNTVFDFLSSSPHPTWIRVTVVTWDEDDDRFEVVWSESTKNQVAWTTGTLSAITPKIPAMSDADTVIVVESSMKYEPLLTSQKLLGHWTLGLPQVEYLNFIVTSPRFAPNLCWETCIEA